MTGDALPEHVLVTGGAGFIGGHVATALADVGIRVTVLDALLPQAWGSSQPQLDPRARFVEGDVRDASLVRTLLMDVDAVCHQAAMVGLGVDMGDLPEYASVNVVGTAVLLAQMAEVRTHRLVLASSMVVYGEGRWICADHGDVRPAPRVLDELEAGRFDPPCPSCGVGLDWASVAEDAPTDPWSVYAATKLAQEHLVAAWQRVTAGTAVALRYHNVYGPHMPRDTPYSGVAALFRSALERGEPPTVFEDGRQQRDFVHVRDVAAANLAALQVRTTGFYAYNVASGTPQTVGAMAAALAEAFGGPAPIVTGQFRLGDARHIVASTERAAAELGFRASVTFEDGVREFARAPLR